MNDEIARLTPATILPNPTPLGRQIVARRTREELVRELKRGQAAGEYGQTSTVVRVPRGPAVGQYAARVEVLSVPPPPAPAWHRTAKVLAGLAAGAGILCVGATFAVRALLAALGEAVSGMPWGTLLGAAGLVAVVLLLGTSAGRTCCRIIIEHRH